jgi:hypothetical protein
MNNSCSACAPEEIRTPNLLIRRGWSRARCWLGGGHDRACSPPLQGSGRGQPAGGRGQCRLLSEGQRISALTPTSSVSRHPDESGLDAVRGGCVRLELGVIGADRIGCHTVGHTRTPTLPGLFSRLGLTTQRLYENRCHDVRANRCQSEVYLHVVTEASRAAAVSMSAS